MGFFSRKKRSTDSSVVSALTPPAVAGSGSGSDISDDYVAPDIEAIEEGVKEEEKEEEVGEDAGEEAAVGGETTPTAAEVAPTLKLEKVPSISIEEQPSTTSAASLSEIVMLGLEKVLSTNEHLSTTFAASLSKTDMESIEDGYVNASITEGGQRQPPSEVIEIEVEEVFNGVKGTVQPPKYKDVKYAWMFVFHFAVTVWWFVDSFFPSYNKYDDSVVYSAINHLGLSAFVVTTGLTGLGLTFITFGYMLRHGETILKTTLVFSTAMCFSVGVIGLCLEEYFMCICGLVGSTIACVYMNMVWSRISFTAFNLSIAIAAVRDNMGLFVAALGVAAIGFVWLIITVTAGVSTHRMYGNWTIVYVIFSYHWTHQVLTNVLSVATAGIIGRWFVIGDETPTFTTGLKEMLTRARTYSFGSICFGSLFFSIVHTIEGLRSFLWAKHVPLLPRLLDMILTTIYSVLGDVNEFACVYVGLYGYSYTAAAKNATMVIHNQGWDGIVKYHLAANVMFMANIAIGLLTGFCGLIFGAFEYSISESSGLTNPTADGFFVGFLVGFLMSSILLSVVAATINTLIVCLAESPAEFKANHPDLSQGMESAWKMKVKVTRSEI